jgi:hypothetical protein
MLRMYAPKRAEGQSYVEAPWEFGIRDSGGHAQKRKGDVQRRSTERRIPLLAYVLDEGSNPLLDWLMDGASTMEVGT